jgi:hypothetical protein
LVFLTDDNPSSIGSVRPGDGPIRTSRRAPLNAFTLNEGWGCRATFVLTQLTGTSKSRHFEQTRVEPPPIRSERRRRYTLNEGWGRRRSCPIPRVGSARFHSERGVSPRTRRNGTLSPRFTLNEGCVSRRGSVDPAGTLGKSVRWRVNQPAGRTTHRRRREADERGPLVQSEKSDPWTPPPSTEGNVRDQPSTELRGDNRAL